MESYTRRKLGAIAAIVLALCIAEPLYPWAAQMVVVTTSLAVLASVIWPEIPAEFLAAWRRFQHRREQRRG